MYIAFWTMCQKFWPPAVVGKVRTDTSSGYSMWRALTRLHEEIAMPFNLLTSFSKFVPGWCFVLLKKSKQ